MEGSAAFAPSDSPHLGHQRTHDDLADSDDELREGRFDVDTDEDEEEHSDHGTIELHEIVTGEGEIPSTSEEAQAGILPRDKQRKTAFYDHAAERQVSHVEAKQFYQRHKLEGQHGSSNWSQDGMSPVIRAKTFPVNLGAERDGFGPGDGLRSQGSVHSFAQSASAYRSALPVGVSGGERAGPDSHTQATGQNAYYVKQETNALLQADIQARAHGHHPKLPHEHKPGMMQEGIHGAGAGVGVGNGPSGFASNDAAVTAELGEVFANIQQVLDLRHKYMRLSLQRPFDNPKDEPGWHIYPPHPEPVWHGAIQRTGTGLNSLSNSTTLDGDESKSAKKQRKPGTDIGEDFVYEECLPVPGLSEMTFKMDEGSVFQVYENSKSMELDSPILHVPTLREYYMDLDRLLHMSSEGANKSYAYRRLSYLEGKFHLYSLVNEYQEVADSKKVPHRDFYNVRKVDTHVHHSACMNQKHLLRFIKSKMKKCPNEVVLERDSKQLTLQEVFESINLTAYDLSIDTLDMHAHTDSFHRFDKFNLKYNPVGESRLRTIFLKTDNFIQGRYLAEITKEVMTDLEASKYQMTEWRISIYGRDPQEWSKLAAWVVDNKLFSPNVRWLIQIPRLYDVYKATKLMEDFEQVIINVFRPLFEVTKDPSLDPKLHIFLQRVIGFDSVDDESKPERRLYKKFPTPKAWTTSQNPPYSYWIYYLFANIASLNVWRKQRGFNTFLLRPHCGEAGDTDHLAAAALCCHSISHGLLLRKVPFLQYIFYLDQIGIAMSPLSNNALFLAYERNPFHSYFKRGLNVSLSTDDPLQFAFTKEPLIEEYSVAAQIYKLSAVDMCELAKHSVEQSGFEHTIKQRWLGSNYHIPGVAGNDVAKVNVPNLREAYRHETLTSEFAMINRYSSNNREALTVDALPQSPQAAAPASPVASTHTNPMAAYPHETGHTQFSHLPPSSYAPPIQPVQAARMNQSMSASDLTIQTGLPMRDGRAYQRGGRSPSMAFSNASNAAQASPSMVLSPDASMSSNGTVHVDTSEPKIFPGVVSRHRTSSIQQGFSNGSVPGRDGISRGNEVAVDTDGADDEGA